MAADVWRGVRIRGNASRVRRGSRAVDHGVGIDLAGGAGVVNGTPPGGDVRALKLEMSGDPDGSPIVAA